MSKQLEAVIKKVTTDLAYSEELKRIAEKASKSQFGSSKEWNLLLSRFVSSPQELSKLKAEIKAKRGTTTITTITTTTSFVCLTTTTTTTTGELQMKAN